MACFIQFDGDCLAFLVTALSTQSVLALLPALDRVMVPHCFTLIGPAPVEPFFHSGARPRILPDNYFHPQQQDLPFCSFRFLPLSFDRFSAANLSSP